MCGLKQRRFAELTYGARSWDRERRVIARLEHGARGANPRFVVTNLAGDGRALYERVYCARGEMENRIKEQQLQLFADRTSCHRWWPNQFRLLLASLAYTLLNAIRRLGLAGTGMARAQCATIRLKLLKIGAVITRNTRRVRFHLSSACPEQVPSRTSSAWSPPASNPDSARPKDRPGQVHAGSATGNAGARPDPAKSAQNSPKSPTRQTNRRRTTAHSGNRAVKSRQTKKRRPFMKYPG